MQDYLADSQLRSFAQEYFQLLETKFRGLNLTAIKDFEDFYFKQIVDSILPLEHGQFFASQLQELGLLLDVGFGGGFPILPLAFKRRDLPFIGLEARKKKVEAVKAISSHLQLSHVHLFSYRIEQVLVDRPCLITFKAVGTCQEFLGKIHATEPAVVYFYKGPRFYELEGSSLKEVQEHWELIEESFIQAPGTEGRWLIGFKQKSVPHGTTLKMKRAQKLLVNLSDIL